VLSLVAIGAQDSYLTRTPQITFFILVYMRHTNFAMESIAQTANGQCDLNRKTTWTISRNGDLITNMWLQVTLPALDQVVTVGGSTSTYVCYVNAVGHVMLKSVEIEIGGQKIDKHFDAYYEIDDELTATTEKVGGLNEMIGKYNEPDNYEGGLLHTQTGQRTYYIPLKFWFNRLPGNALPLIALQYHECRLNVDLAPAAALVRSDINVVSPTSNGAPLSLLDCSHYVDYIYLDTDERRKFAASSHEFLVEQVQFTGDESIPASLAASTEKIRLSFNPPVKELIWVVTPESSAAINSETGNMIFDYGEVANVDYVQSAKLMLNGHDRYSERPGTYHRLVQPYQHHPRVPKKHVYVYSFSLEALSHQPSGSTNFSRIDNSTLYLTFPPNMVPARCKIIGINFNILRIMSGMAGLALKNRAEKARASMMWALIVETSFEHPSAEYVSGSCLCLVGATTARNIPCS
jgi:hypothetical protein